MLLSLTYSFCAGGRHFIEVDALGADAGWSTTIRIAGHIASKNLLLGRHRYLPIPVTEGGKMSRISTETRKELVAAMAERYQTIFGVHENAATPSRGKKPLPHAGQQ